MRTNLNKNPAPQAIERALRSINAGRSRSPPTGGVGGGHRAGAVHARPTGFDAFGSADLTVLVVLSRRQGILVVCPAILYPFRGLCEDARDVIVEGADSPFRVVTDSGRMVVRPWAVHEIPVAALPEEAVARLPRRVVGALRARETWRRAVPSRHIPGAP